jgi:hypothetical protein
MIDATKCPDGFYGPVVIPVMLRVANGVATPEPHDEYNFVLTGGDPKTGRLDMKVRPVVKI